MRKKLSFTSKGSTLESQWMKMIFISIGLHLLILGLFLNVYPHGRTVKRLAPAYFIDLVSLPGQGPAGSIPKTKGPTAPPVLPPPRVKSKPVSIPKPIPEKPIKKEDQSKTLDKALEQLKQKVQKEKDLEKTMARMEDKVKEEQAFENALARLEKKKQGTSKPGVVPGSSGTGNISSSTPGGQEGVGMQFQLYQAYVIGSIKNNWALPEGLRKGKDISADVMVRIGRSGQIEDFRFERKSGIELFDQEVNRTLKKSSPVPPLPQGYPKNNYIIFLTFHSQDLSGN